ncbi:MAG TPA: hypothetical protein VES73_12095 [Lamprocystis sp. (in: g-proteobacteria)]|nr:hypothetical protein [Lamprocystis sp. (in: g-proteobacteria)]
MRNNTTLRVAALAAPLAMVVALSAPANATDGMDTYWKATPTTTAWVNPYGECWQGVEGENLPPCAFKPRAALVLRLLFELDRYGLQNIRNPEELGKVDDLIKEFLATPR